MSPVSAATSRAPAFGALLLTMALWGSNSTVAKLMLGSFAPITLTCVRWVVVVAITAPFAWAERDALRGALKTGWRPLLLLALLGGALQNSVVFFGLAHTSAIHLGLMNSVIPVLILLLGWLFFGETLHAKEAIGVGISAVGVVVIFFQGSLEVLRSLAVMPGDPIVLVGMVLWAVYTLTLNRRPSTISLSALMFVIGLVSLPLAAPLVWWEMRTHPFPQMTPALWAGLLYMSTFTTLIAMLFYGYGVKRIGPMQASVFIHIMPPFAAVFAAVFIGEALRWYHGAGFLLVASGAILSCYRPAPVLQSMPPSQDEPGAARTAPRP